MSDIGEGGVGDERPEKRRGLDLSVPQVAGSAVAAIVAAKLASNLGVYGTIMGAGVVSVLGTCGGSLLQHAFHRTGRHVHEVAGHVHEVATSARPKARHASAHPAADTGTHTAADTAVRDIPGSGVDFAKGTASTGRPGDTGLAMTTGHPESTDLTAAPFDTGGYSTGTVHRARGLRWKRPAAAVALAFGLTMGGITVCELASGQNISGHGNGTTIGDAFTGHNSPHSGNTPSPGGTDHPSGGPSSSTRGTGDPTPSGTGPSATTTAPTAPAPSHTPAGGSGGGTGAGGATGGAGGSVRPSPSTPSTSPSPSPSTSGGTDGGTDAGTDGGFAPQATP